jgi:hypothetical protein
MTHKLQYVILRLIVEESGDFTKVTEVMNGIVVMA